MLLINTKEHGLDSSLKLDKTIFGEQVQEGSCRGEAGAFRPEWQGCGSSFISVSPLSWASVCCFPWSSRWLFVGSGAACLSERSFSHGSLTGEMGFEPCYAEVLSVVQGKLHQPDEVRKSSFYAFSYYYDRAVDTDMIGRFTPGNSLGRRLGRAVLGKGKGEEEYLKCFVVSDLTTLLQCWLLNDISCCSGRVTVI